MYTKEEKEFLDACDSFRDDLHHARHFLLIHFAYYRTYKHNRDLEAKLNEHGRFWNTIDFALVGSLFTALGRIYDSGGNTLTFLLDRAKKNEHIFKGCVNSLYFDSLESYYLEYRDIYNRACQVARTKVLAHTLFLDSDRKKQAFANIDEREVFELIAFAHNMLSALLLLFHKRKATEIPFNLPEYPHDWYLSGFEPWQAPSLDEWGLCDQVNDFLMSQLRIPVKETPS